MAIDTLEYAKKLEAAGVDRKQAEAHAEALRSFVTSDLVSKADLQEARAALQADIHELRTEMWKIALGIVLATASLTAFIQKML